MKAKDLMEPVSAYLSPDDTLKDAVGKMRVTKRWHGQGMKGMIVLDNDGKMVGVLAIKDILRATVPKYFEGRVSEFSWDGMLEEQARKTACQKIGEIMSTKIITVNENDSLMKCVDLMIEHKLQRLPVLGSDGKVSGVLYIRDLYNVVAKLFDAEECAL